MKPFDQPDQHPFPPRIPPADRLAAHWVSIGDYQQEAEERLHPALYQYISGGAGDGLSLQANRTAFDQIQLMPRLLQDFSNPSTACGSGGLTLAHPLMLAPVAHQGLLHPDAEIATARGAAEAAVPMVVSSYASRTLESIQQATPTDAPKWFQLYWQPDRQANARLLQRAASAGYEAVVITLDAPISGLNNRAERAGFRLPPDCHPNLEPLKSAINGKSGCNRVLNGAMSLAPSSDDLKWLRDILPLPLLAKGVLNPADAIRLKEDLGLDGVIVSNHGGRTQDGFPPGVTMLPAIRQALGPDYPILLDSGIRRGSDIFKAVALGADAVLIGRPQAWALSVAGQAGVRHMLALLQHELETCMALVGCPQLANACPDFLTGQ